jgi:hypothetical protein
MKTANWLSILFPGLGHCCQRKFVSGIYLIILGATCFYYIFFKGIGWEITYFKFLLVAIWLYNYAECDRMLSQSKS